MINCDLPDTATLNERIQAAFEQLSPELQRAARWLSDHGVSVVTQSMRRSAQSAGVAPATMTRLAKALGYSGFEAMREPAVQDAFAQASDFVSKAATQQAHKSEGASLCAQLGQQHLLNVESVLRRNALVDLESAADLLLSADKVAFLGLRAAHGIAFHMHYTCRLLRPQVLLMGDHAGTMGDELWSLGPQDMLVAVGQSPYTRATVQLAAQAKEQGCEVLALTDSALGPLALGASRHLLFDAGSPSFFHSLTGAQALVETLVALMAARGGEAVMAHLTAAQTHLNQTKAYWEKAAGKPMP
jgi:DNA-binding MurR/RpiR family transcriptional regulator